MSFHPTGYGFITFSDRRVSDKLKYYNRCTVFSTEPQRQWRLCCSSLTFSSCFCPSTFTSWVCVRVYQRFNLLLVPCAHCQTQEGEDSVLATCFATKVWLKGMTLIYVGSRPPVPLTVSTLGTISCLLPALLSVWKFSRHTHSSFHPSVTFPSGFSIIPLFEWLRSCSLCINLAPRKSEWRIY